MSAEYHRNRNCRSRFGTRRWPLGFLSIFEYAEAGDVWISLRYLYVILVPFNALRHERAPWPRNLASRVLLASNLFSNTEHSVIISRLFHTSMGLFPSYNTKKCSYRILFIKPIPFYTKNKATIMCWVFRNEASCAQLASYDFCSIFCFRQASAGSCLHCRANYSLHILSQLKVTVTRYSRYYYPQIITFIYIAYWVRSWFYVYTTLVSNPFVSAVSSSSATSTSSNFYFV